ncbi:MAG: hypothetical protein OEY38_16195 [Gammaproteobacteria bacterium]|nr:hypothetical protein [Gammaproteobacteria bacterium]
MAIKKEAAYHEASHAVVAHKSKFHSLVGDVNLEQYGAGEIFISLSKSKCTAAGKKAAPETQKDKEVAKELAVILCAGLMGEEIAAEKDSSLTPNEQCSVPDHELAVQQLKMAGLSSKYDFHQNSAREILNQEWETVERLTAYLFENHSADPSKMAEIIDAV